MGARVKITKTKFAKAVVGTGGIMINIAKNLGVDRGTVYQFCNKYPDMMQLRYDEEEKIVDNAEDNLFSKIDNGDNWAVKYLLATKGKKRGYVEKTEMAHTAEITNKLSEKQLKDAIAELKD